MTEQFLDPQRQLFLEHYCNPKKDTFSNAYLSAKAAGYSENYAKNILYVLPDWLTDRVGDMKRLRRAERLLDKIMDHEHVDEQGKIDSALVGNQIKAVTLVLKGIGKSKYSERSEITGKDGGPIQTEDLSELSDEELDRLIKESKGGESKEGES